MSGSAFAIASAGYLASFCRGPIGGEFRERLRRMQQDMDKIFLEGKCIRVCNDCTTVLECATLGACIGSAI